MLQRREPVLIEEKPDWVLVYGDTREMLRVVKPTGIVLS
jgi:UDP-N-acetylglucosamine 2-epimerase